MFAKAYKVNKLFEGRRRKKNKKVYEVEDSSSIIIYPKYFAVSDWLPAYPSQPTGSYHLWKMRIIYHRFDGKFDWKRGFWMVYLIRDEAAWAKDHR